MQMHLIHTVRLAVALGVVCGVAMAPDTVRGADLAAVLNATDPGSASPEPATPPALLPQSADAHPAAQADASDSSPVRHGLRFPTRILLLSGAKADATRSLIVLGAPDGESPAQTLGTAGEPATGQATDSTQQAPAAKQAAVGETSAADRPSTPEPSRQAGPAPLDRGRDPLAGTQRIDPAVTGGDAEAILARMLPPRTDTGADWFAPLEPLHFCGEPRALAPCVPPPPCHPALPPQPFDLVGTRGTPTCGPIYGGPCDPRTGTCHEGPLAPFHRACDRLFDCFYTPR
jgi:hypothetical protein